MKLSKPVRILWGVALVLVNLMFMGWVWLFGSALFGNASLWDNFLLFVALSGLVGTAGLVVFVASAVHLFMSPLVAGHKVAWAVAMLVGAYPAMLVYWFIHVRVEPADPPSQAPAPAPV